MNCLFSLTTSTTSNLELLTNVSTLFNAICCESSDPYSIPVTVGSNCAASEGIPPTVALDGYKK